MEGSLNMGFTGGEGGCRSHLYHRFSRQCWVFLGSCPVPVRGAVLFRWKGHDPAAYPLPLPLLPASQDPISKIPVLWLPPEAKCLELAYLTKNYLGKSWVEKRMTLATTAYGKNIQYSLYPRKGKLNKNQVFNCLHWFVHVWYFFKEPHLNDLTRITAQWTNIQWHEKEKL